MMPFLEQMQAVLGSLALVVVVILYARRTWGRARGKRPTTTGNVFEVIHEVFSPARHSAAMELQDQQQRGPVTPVPDDWLPPSRNGVYVVKRTPAPTDLPHLPPDTVEPPVASADLGTSDTTT